MKINKTKIYLWAASLVSSIIILMLIFNYLAYNPAYYDAQFKKLGIYDREPEADKIANEIIQFFKGKDLVTSKLTLNEKNHLADVKKVFGSMRIVLYTLTVSLLFIFFLIIKKLKTRKRLKDFLGNCLIISSVILLLVILILSLSLLSFSWAFENMHELFFPQGNYSFPEESVLIILFPEQFFINLIKQNILNNFIIGIFMLGLGLLIKGKTGRNQKL